MNSDPAELKLKAIDKVKQYIKSEFLSCSHDYQALQMVNNVTREKYTELSVIAQRLIQQSSNASTQRIL